MRCTVPIALVCAGAALAGCRPPEKLDPIPLDGAEGPEAEDFSSEEDLAERYDAEIEAPFLALPERSFEGVDGLTLRYRVSPVNAPKGAVLLLGGRTEAAFKHAENIFDLNAMGYTVYALDHRGHGASDRMLENPEICHVEWFMDYVEDVGSFVDEVVRAEHAGPLFVMAHSMGAAIAALRLWQAPESFDGAVFSSPMFGIDTGAFPPSVAQTLSSGVCSAAPATGYTVGHSDYDGDYTLEESDVTHSAVRFELKQALYEEYPEIRLGGASWRWVCESLWAAEHLQRLGGETPTRTLILEAGDERVVLPEAEERWCREAPGCQLEVVEGALHEIFSEADAYRNPSLALAVRFMDALVEAE